MSVYPSEPGDGHGRRQVFLALFFLGVAGAMLYLPPSSQQQVSGTLRATVLHPFVVAQQGVIRARARADDLEALRVRMDSLVAGSVGHRVLEEENRRLRALLDLRERGGADFVPAIAIRPGTRGSESMFVVDVGERDGVVQNAPVIAPEGLVGIIREVGASNSVGMDWTHPDFRASVMTVDGSAYGIVEPRQSAFREADRLLLDGLPFHADVADSVAIVTSGLGGVYPRGLMVGRVSELHEAAAGWRRSYWLEPAVNVAGVTHVLVLVGDAVRGPPPREADEGGEEGSETVGEDDAEEGAPGWSFLWLAAPPEGGEQGESGEGEAEAPVGTDGADMGPTGDGGEGGE